MELFSNDIINVTKILSINKYEVTKFAPTDISYSPNLKAHELIFFVSGGSDTHFCGVDIKDCENSLRYLPKGDSKGNYTVKNIRQGYCIDIYFDTDTPMPNRAYGFLDMEILKDKFIKIFNVWNEKKPDYYIKSMALIYEIIALFRNNNNKYISSQQKLKMNTAYNYILENYTSHNFDYRELCSVTGLSYSYFNELFTAKYKMPPVKFVTKMKIDLAKELLITNRYKITEIAEKCGFNDVYYFSNVFKKITGVSPKTFK